MKKLSVAYFGSSDFSADFLEKILIDPTSPFGLRGASQLVEVKFVVTQPDRPVGRKQILTPTPVKIIAQKYGLDILEISNIKIENSLKISNLKLKIRGLDLVILYAYAGIIPQKWLDQSKLGFWCFHPSLLPKYRGTSPMATALINGDNKTGMTIIKMDAQIDHGPIIAQESSTVEKNDKRPDLEKKLTNLGFKMFKKIVTQGINKMETKEQNHRQATYTKKLKKDDGFIEFKNLIPPLARKNSPEILYNLFRGLFPWPGLWTILPNGKRLKITNMKLCNINNLLTLELLEVQLEGKKEVDFETFKKAYKIF